ncbi:sensor histidine kinase [Nocardioides rotundus]|uniref:sensor histidine kinase n=1 Tax=Nocardioides rotundus TaxID=1774216 RepID=UPI001CBAE358|nr:sensor histidine kinase [Nocardioides rotundus]UAL29043.1 sensor histidine kinase [Nocardioides rotundus]
MTVMTHGSPWAAPGPGLERLRWLVPPALLAVVIGSLYVVWLNKPDTWQAAGALIVLGCSVFAALSSRSRRLLIGFAAFGGGVAVAMTSREFFSFWPAACVLLTTSAVAEWGLRARSLPPVTAFLAVAGLIAAALGPDAQLAAPLLPIVAAAAAAGLVRLGVSRIKRSHDLEARAAEYRHRAEASEAENLELQRRTALARELHDSLGHHVSAIVVQAEAGRVDRADEALASIADLGRQALDELEGVLFDLRASTSETPETTEVDLGRIDSRLAQPLRHQGVLVDVQVRTIETNPAHLAAVYRVVQEALTNTLRHAGAGRVDVVVRDEGNDLVVHVHDDGVGIAAGAPVGNGLQGIRERASLLGGEADITSPQSGGTRVLVRIPRTDT